MRGNTYFVCRLNLMHLFSVITSKNTFTFNNNLLYFNPIHGYSSVIIIKQEKIIKKQYFKINMQLMAYGILRKLDKKRFINNFKVWQGQVYIRN